MTDYLAHPDIETWTSRVMKSLAGCRGSLPLPSLGRSALLAVDLQRLFVDPASPAFVPAWASAAGPFQRLLRAARKAAIPVIWTRHAHAREDPGETILHFFGRLILDGDPLASFGHGYGPPQGEHEVVKGRHSVFFETGLKALLARERIEVVILAGVQAPLCILASAIEAGQMGLIPVVVADGVAARTEREHTSTLAVLGAGLAHLATSSQVVEGLSQVRLNGKRLDRRPGRSDVGAYDLLVVGGGPAGVAAAFQAMRDGLSVCMVSEEKPGGLLRAAGVLANVPGLPPGIEGPLLADNLERACLELNGLRVERGRVVSIVQEEGGCFSASWIGQEGAKAKAVINSKTVILATGTMPAPFSVDGLDELERKGRFHRDVRTLSSDLAHLRVTVIGSGDAALDTALTARKRGAQVVLLARGTKIRAAGHLVRMVTDAGVEIIKGVSAARVALETQGVLIHLAGYSGRNPVETDHLVACIGRIPRDELLAGLRSGPGSSKELPDALFLAGDIAAGHDRFVHRALGDGQLAASRARNFLARAIRTTGSLAKPESCWTK